MTKTDHQMEEEWYAHSFTHQRAKLSYPLTSEIKKLRLKVDYTMSRSSSSGRTTHSLGCFASGQFHQLVLGIVEPGMSIAKLSPQLLDDGILCSMAGIVVTLEIVLLTFHAILQSIQFSLQLFKSL